MVVACNSNAQLGRLAHTEQHTEGRFSVPAYWTDNGGNLVQVSSDRRLFLANSNFCHKKRHRHPILPSWPCALIDNIPIGHRWCEPVENYSSPQMWTQIIAWFVLAFVCIESVLKPTWKLRVLHIWFPMTSVPVEAFDTVVLSAKCPGCRSLKNEDDSPLCPATLCRFRKLISLTTAISSRE